MSTREIYALIATLAATGVAWLIGGWAAALAFVAGMTFSHVSLDWIPPEELDE